MDTATKIPRIRNDKLIQFCAPEILSDALEEAADRRLVSKSGYIRAALLDRLKIDGLDPMSPKKGAVWCCSGHSIRYSRRTSATISEMIS